MTDKELRHVEVLNTIRSRMRPELVIDCPAKLRRKLAQEIIIEAVGHLHPDLVVSIEEDRWLVVRVPAMFKKRFTISSPDLIDAVRTYLCDIGLYEVALQEVQ